MNQVSSWAGVLGMVLFQYHLSMVAQLTRVSGFRPTEVLLPGAGFCLGAVFGAVAIDLIASRDAPSSLSEAGASRRANLRLAALLLLPAYALGVRLFIFDEWTPLYARFATQIGNGFFLAAAHWVFFALAPRRRAAAAFCAALGAGYALAECQRLIFFADPPAGPAEYAELLHLRGVLFAALLLAAALAPGMAAAIRSGPEPSGDGEKEEGDWRTVGSILLLLAVFFVLHGLVSSAFLPFYLVSRVLDDAGFITAMTAAALAGGAWLFGRGFAGGFRLVATACGIVHLTVPAFSLFKANAPIQRFIHALAVPLDVLFTAAAMAALAMAAPRRWRVTLVAVPFAAKAAAVLYIPRLLQSWPDSETLALAALLTAVAFFVYGQKIVIAAPGTSVAPPSPSPAAAVPPVSGDVREGDDAPPPPIAAVMEETPPPAAAAAGEDAGTKLRRVIERIGADHELSVREGEVAELLASGLPVDAIGERLGLAQATVHTYVRRIVIKTGRAGRRDFVAMARGMLDAED